MQVMVNLKRQCAAGRWWWVWKHATKKSTCNTTSITDSSCHTRIENGMYN